MPGFGTKAVDRIIATRRLTSIRADDLARLHIPRNKALPFIVLSDHRPLAASAGWRRVGGAVQAEGDAIGIWVLSMEPEERHAAHITLDGETDFDGWRKAARALVLNDVKPSDVTWSVAATRPNCSTPTNAAAGAAARHLQRTGQIRRTGADRDPAPQPGTVRPALPPAVAAASNITICSISRPIPMSRELAAMAKAVRRDEHKMHAFVRFREIGREHEVAFRRLVRAGASYRRTGGAVLRAPVRRHAVVDPDAGRLRALGRPCRLDHAGRRQGRAPTEDRLEETWRQLLRQSIFNPARLKVKAMQNEMPKKYWRNLPEASLIKPLIEGAERATRAR